MASREAAGVSASVGDKVPFNPMLTITTLKKRADFIRLRRGKKYIAPMFILRSAPSDVPLGDAVRVGYTVTTKCGNAVIRNRTKRRLRALVRELFPASAKAGYDYILIARDDAKPSAADAPFEELRAALAKALTRIHA